jgi:hypothetical protein
VAKRFDPKTGLFTTTADPAAAAFEPTPFASMLIYGAPAAPTAPRGQSVATRGQTQRAMTYGELSTSNNESGTLGGGRSPKRRAAARALLE